MWYAVRRQTLIYLVGSSLFSSISWSGQNRPQVSPCQSLSGMGSSGALIARPLSTEVFLTFAPASSTSWFWEASTQSVLDLTMARVVSGYHDLTGPLGTLRHLLFRMCRGGWESRYNNAGLSPALCLTHCSVFVCEVPSSTYRHHQAGCKVRTWLLMVL